MRLGLVVAFLPFPVWADAQPLSPLIESVTVGVFCPEDFMTKQPAPETEVGYILTPSAEPVITWQTTEVPARMGLAFGLQITQVPGPPIGPVEVQVTRPLQSGGTGTDRWDVYVGPEGTSTNFWVFNDPAEIVEGPWRFELKLGAARLADVTFQVMDPKAVTGPVPDCILALS